MQNSQESPRRSPKKSLSSPTKRSNKTKYPRDIISEVIVKRKEVGKGTISETEAQEMGILCKAPNHPQLGNFTFQDFTEGSKRKKSKTKKPDVIE